VGEERELTATFLYATPGAEGPRQAIRHLNGEQVPKTVTLETMQITSENVDEVLKQHGM
jgi:ribose transport system substrate-binding protein